MRRLGLPLLVALHGCTHPPPLPIEVPTSVVVTLAQGQRTGCEEGEGPLPFETEITIDMAVIGADGAPFPYDGQASFRMSPGVLADPHRRITLTSGAKSGIRLPVRLSFGGDARIWAELSDEHGAQATGVSPRLCFDRVRVRDVQESDRSYRSPFEGQDVGFSGTRHRLVATGATTRGFYFTDLDDDEWNSLFVFTFSNPTGVEIGSRLCEVSGGVKEFIGFTEIVFPTWRVYHPLGRAAARQELEDLVDDDEVPDPRDDESVVFRKCDLPEPELSGEAAVPDPILLRPDVVPRKEVPVYRDAHLALDRHEASLVAVKNVTLPTEFRACDRNGNGRVDRCFDSDCGALNLNDAEDVAACVCSPGGGIDCMRGSCGCTCAELQETICEQDCAGRVDCTELATFEEFGQWGVTLGNDDDDSRINVITRDALPNFDPSESTQSRAPPWDRGTIYCVVGNLRQINAASLPWAIQPRRASDIIFQPPEPGEWDPCRE